MLDAVLAGALDKAATNTSSNNTTGRVAALRETIYETLRSEEVRRQVYIEANEEVDGLSMMEIHTVLDSLIEVLGDEVDE